MKWISNLDKKFVIPIFLGISLTTLGCISLATLFYPVFEKDDETKDDSNNTKRSCKIITSTCTPVEYKIPKQFASAVIGRGGSMIQKIQDATGTIIIMSNNDIECPYRLCMIHGNEIEGIRLAKSMIKNIVDNQPIIETYEMFVPFEVCGSFGIGYFGILKKHGGIVQQIQRSSGAKLTLENDVHKSEDGWKSKIIIKGTAEQIALAVTQIKDKIQEEHKARAQLKCEQTTTARTPRTSPSKNNQSIIETYEFFVPHKVWGRIIEKNENTVQQIQSFSGVEIVIPEKDPANISQNDESSLMLRGTGEQIELAIAQMKNKIREEIDLNVDLTITSRKIPTYNPAFDNIYMDDDRSESSQISLVQEDVMEVYVTVMATPSLFWIHVVGPANRALDNLVFEMTEYYNKEENRELHTLEKIIPGQMVAAKAGYEKKWYRAQVVGTAEDFLYCLFYVDYGETVVLPPEDILELRTDMLAIRVQAVQCSVANMKPYRENFWTSEACDMFSKLLHVGQWKPLIAKVKGYKKHPRIGYGDTVEDSLIPCIDLYDTDGNKVINVRETMIRSGLAQFEEEDWSIASSTLSEDKHDFSSDSSHPTHLG
ncbi:tudor and KH domain-containing protein-like isoform X2 [Cataglyphis hispanica]|uniref:tudor and KH domain-containing protein-like isoform X2 n=1 Tax=Cataglyphis hispanica TaxID=1086592 RepID=UPI00217FF42B|nr:tudor and KH domain-containing protein-like isoform X2 [Cataglyphis hispanica]